MSDLEKNIIHLLTRMSLEEKADFMTGKDMWFFKGLKNLDIACIRLSDCGHGLTLTDMDPCGTTCFPTSVGMASTWNKNLLFSVGQALGRETRKSGNAILLGPMINIHRFPLGGRNYETFSEDPLLTGNLATAIIKGIQSVGAGACIKSCAANNQQHNQGETSSEVDERSLREIYLRGFEIALKEARPMGLMTSYNL